MYTYVMSKLKKLEHEAYKLAQTPAFLTIVLTAIIIITGLLLISQIMRFKAEGYLTPHPRIHHRQVFTPPTSVGQIKLWMTFEYINRIFLLPKDYLRNSLSIEDPRYPHISIGSFAQKTHQDPSLLLRKTEQAIIEFKNNSTTR
jgi:hypothetical protein